MMEDIETSLIIPCRNEKNYVTRCLESIKQSDYPLIRLEVILVDGMSTDGTTDLINNYVSSFPHIKIVTNKKTDTPSGLNLGIKYSNGKYIIILSSHSKVEKTFISTSVREIEKYKADCIGGVMITLPSSDTPVSKAIALALSHKFGVGNGYFRIGSKDVKVVDTVPFGCYQRNVFDTIGLFDENLIRNQDIELNLRLKNAKGKIILSPNIVSYYHARPHLKGLFKQNFLNGYWVIKSLKYAKTPFSLRHLIPFFFAGSLTGSLLLALFHPVFLLLFGFISILYISVNSLVSYKLSAGNGLFFQLVLAFTTLHLSYGIGSMWGLIHLLINR